MSREPLKVVYEHSSPEDLESNVYDGMQDELGDDVLSSDYDGSLGEVWPGVNPIELPEAYRREGQFTPPPMVGPGTAFPDAQPIVPPELADDDA